jgi:hypothetical protein
VSYQEDFSRRAKEVRARLWNTPPRAKPVIIPPPSPPPEPWPEPVKFEAPPPSPEIEVLNLEAEVIDAPPALSRQAIARAVARHFDIGYSEIIGRPRTARVVRPRQIAIYICWRATGCSLPAIAKLFGRDHTTALYALRLIKAAIDGNCAEIAGPVKAIMASLGISFDAPRVTSLINSDWSEEEIEKLRYLRSVRGYSIERIGDEMPDRSIGSISVKLKRQGITKGKPVEEEPRPKRERPPRWTPQQDAILRKLYGPRLWAMDAADEIKRSPSAVRHRAGVLGLPKKGAAQ